MTSRGRSGSRERWAYAPYLLPGLLLFTAVIGVPFLMNIGTSFTEWTGVGTPRWIGLGNYRELARDEQFWASFGHNALIIVGMAVVPTMIGLVLASVLTDLIGRHFGARTASVLRACIYLPQVLPIVIAGVVWSWLLAPEDGAVNALLDAVGLGSLAHDWLGDPATALWSVIAVMVWIQIGFPLVIFMSGLQRVDPSLYEAAEIDGASWTRRFWHITIPQIRPEIFVVLLWTTIAALKAFAHIFVLTKGGPGGATNVPAYYSWVSFFEKSDVGYGSAIATVLTLVVVALTVVFLRMQGRELGEER
ncbi:carbohydrate ABC transporter permease [Actinomadura livida]|uniref:Raffinose/stachyose/melibiose transport system permease protein n=1 Tax=Actinomadura livida TaxID=79909 RepID=A0A7W7IC97_9ACTN|nr:MULTISPECIES: sugar ABC transporter permease [Actinomadura]MBB4774108.1 raffinose/stachyose/melibiose transport system permease protein [Actinomadura catellatispora]GGT84834.1 ABC transporter permease [Actinomadura livida]